MLDYSLEGLLELLFLLLHEELPLSLGLFRVKFGSRFLALLVFFLLLLLFFLFNLFLDGVVPTKAFHCLQAFLDRFFSFTSIFCFLLLLKFVSDNLLFFFTFLDLFDFNKLIFKLLISFLADIFTVDLKLFLFATLIITCLLRIVIDLARGTIEARRKFL